jgi:Zn ribbon nucleic-acid-binding protein
MAQERTMQLSKVQRFQIEVINRRELIDCPYNPRQIDDRSKKKLRANLKKVGLLQPVIWNRRTKHIVSGHQRLSLIDSIERRNDYNLQVSVVDLDEKTEKEQVVFLNNELAMGSYDLPKLENLLGDVSFEACGFDKLDLEVLLPGWAKEPSDAAREQLEEVEQLAGDLDDLDEIREKKAKVRDQGNQRTPENTDIEFFVVLVFRNRDDSDTFLDSLKIDRNEKYIAGELVANAIKKGNGNGTGAKPRAVRKDA